MPRYLISLGYISDTPTNRFIAEWIEVASTIYFSSSLPGTELQNAAVAAGGFVAYDDWVRKRLN